MHEDLAPRYFNSKTQSLNKYITENMKNSNVFVCKSVIIPKTRAKWVSVNETKHNVPYF